MRTGAIILRTALPDQSVMRRLSRHHGPLANLQLVPRCFQWVKPIREAKALSFQSTVAEVRSSGRRPCLPRFGVKAQSSGQTHRHGGLWLRQANLRPTENSEETLDRRHGHD